MAEDDQMPSDSAAHKPWPGQRETEREASIAIQEKDKRRKKICTQRRNDT